MRSGRNLSTMAAVGVIALSACGGNDGSECCPVLPQSGLYATFRVVDETFHASITDADGMAEARALWSGDASANIPNGLLACAPRTWNAPWSWHLVPESIRFAEVTVEVCDGRPAYVEDNCASFGERYCPWGSEMIELRDCDAAPDCPLVPR